MTTTEKIAATYLRLNGFFLLPLFTVFDGKQHNHIDILGLRAAASAESIGSLSLPVDKKLFERFREMGVNPNKNVIGVIVEVKTGDVQKKISPEHIEYAKRFMAIDNPFSLWFSNSEPVAPQFEQGHLRISLPYAIDWIIERFDQMEEMKHVLAKHASWAWSEEFLADLLVLRSLGVLKRVLNQEKR